MMNLDRMAPNDWGRLIGHLALPVGALVLGALGVAIRRWHERAGADWPTTEGQVQFVRVIVGEGRDHLKHAVITYSYFIGQYESGEYVRTFLTERSAWDFADAMKEKRVLVHYNPDKPANSTLLKEELERMMPVPMENRIER